MLRSFLAPLLCACLLAVPTASAAVFNCVGGSVVPHADDDLLFQSPTLLQDVQAKNCVTNIVLTAGDNGGGLAYAQSREQGNQAAYAYMASANNTYTEFMAVFGGQSVLIRTLEATPNVQKVFFRLPDGNLAGQGYAVTGYESLRSLYFGTIPTISSISGDATYTLATLKQAIGQILTARQPTYLRTQDYLSAYDGGDHADHLTTARLVKEIAATYASSATLSGFMGYPIQNLAPTLSMNSKLFNEKSAAFFTYTPYDPEECQSLSACSNRGEYSWLQRSYVVTSALATTSSDGAALAPATLPNGTDIALQAIATASSVAPGSSVGAVNDGVFGGYPGNETAEWSSDGEKAGAWVRLTWKTPVVINAVVLYDRPNTVDWLTAGTLTFDDGSLVSFTNPINDGTASQIALPKASYTTSSLLLTVTATSASTINVGLSELQWATLGQGVGAYLTLAWNAPIVANRIILNDRPNLNDQVLGGKVNFSDGSTLVTGVLNNDGSATTFDFPAKTFSSLWFTVTSVSNTTLNIGLSEFQVYYVPLAPASTSASTASTPTLTSSSVATTPASSSVSSPAPSTVSSGTTSASSAPAATSSTSSVTSLDLALNATAGASSWNDATTQTPDKAIDGIWATLGQGVGAYLTLAWNAPIVANRIILNDRPNLNDQVLGGKVNFSDGSTLVTGVLNNDGSATTFDFPAKTFSSLWFTVTSVSNTTLNIGLSEFQVYYVSGPSAASTSVATTSAATSSASTTTSPPATTAAGTTSSAASSGAASSTSTRITIVFSSTSSASLSSASSTSSSASPTSSAPAPSSTLSLSGSPDLALNAIANASSWSAANLQTPDKAIDGVISGYKEDGTGDYTKEWATNGEGVGAWLSLTWSSPVTINRLILNDRPNLNDQILGGVVSFSDGSNVTVTALNNDGSDTTFSIAQRTISSLKLTVTNVSSTTLNIGLSEFRAYSI
ncbi:hypothetical protein Rt10032_c14g5368 [Rhodotorula toruloides]|uniref:N-acetylglucosaminylphosphatidylinositol deacetylase n=1 Tax=Rhodotorula toruloides TaxID=5286 RepID=A0A511KLZ2_RHOTO|nr:hypothetical protein Rt10032_c14g5368 [Rhodotorula toruloides]